MEASERAGASNTRCITCGLSVGDPPRLNQLTNGQVCPTCRDRVLASLPPALPGGPRGREARGERERTGRTELELVRRRGREHQEPEHDDTPDRRA